MSPLNFAGRRFQLWRYNVSHGQLLLRSTKAPDLTTRIDLLFKGVVALKLSAEMSNPTVHAATQAEAKSIMTEFSNVAFEGHEIYVLSSSAGAGYVVAVSLQQMEDEGEYDDPSHLFSNL